MIINMDRVYLICSYHMQPGYLAVVVGIIQAGVLMLSNCGLLGLQALNSRWDEWLYDVMCIQPVGSAELEDFVRST
jgi:hypothetical protein